MSGTGRFNGQMPGKEATGTPLRLSAVHDLLEPVVESAVGVVRQTASLVGNVAGLGLALLFDKKVTAPRRHIAPKANVIPFPTDRSSNRRGWTGVKHDRRQ
ncbi:hypothetical protein [Bradyrhizobium sp.]|jgi:hypothetical protein|uniref:hypothetical protein n=1 Tax=Bradyrhizobium sp. TaxID=376 RepID=UPI00391976EF